MSLRKKNSNPALRVTIFAIAGLFAIGGPLVLLNQESLFQNTQSEAYQAASDRFLAIPKSNAGAYVSPGKYTLKISSTNNLHKWVQNGVDESKVFKGMLIHKEADSKKAYKNWTLKIGQGGQIYSLYVDGYGETIPYQRVTHGQWVDEVMQHVISSIEIEQSVTAVDWDIHEAGVYNRSDVPPYSRLLSHSLYNFSMPLQKSDDGKAVSWESWPQHAHLPFTWKDNQLLYTRELRDLGDGVIEVTQIYSRWGGTIPMDHFVAPWFGARPSTLPYQVVSNPDGTYRWVDKNMKFGDPASTIKRNETNGWLAVLSGQSLSSVGMGIVFSPERQLPLETKPGIVRLAGLYDAIPTDLNPDNGGKTGAIIYKLNLGQRERVVLRYYLVIGTLTEIQKYGNLLSKQVILEKATVEESDVSKIRLAINTQTGNIRRGVSKSTDKLIGYSHRQYVAGDRPLFLVTKADGTKHITSDPYKLGYDPSKTAVIIDLFLGWGITSTSVTSGKCYQTLVNAISSVNSTSPQVKVADDAKSIKILCK
jgi:hypothetical protein